MLFCAYGVQNLMLFIDFALQCIKLTVESVLVCIHCIKIVFHLVDLHLKELDGTNNPAVDATWLFHPFTQLRIFVMLSFLDVSFVCPFLLHIH